MPKVLPKMWAMWATHPVGASATTLVRKFAYHVTGTSRQEIHLIPISEVGKGPCLGLLNIM